MPITIGSGTTLTIKRPTKHPFTYVETNVEQGVVARAWEFEALFLPAEWVTLNSIYTTWNTARLGEPDTLLAGTVGTTVPLTGTANGLSWSAVGCWFTSAPKGDQAGRYVKGSFALIDAAQALAALLRGEELSRERADATAVTYSSITVGGVALTILEEPETRGDGPSVVTAATGTDVIEGPLRPVKTRRIKGYGPNAGRTDFDTLLSWYDTQCATKPTVGTWYPISPPTAEPRIVVEGGVKSTRYDISLELRYIQ